MLRLQVGGHRAYLEPDVVAFQINGKFHVIEIKSFAVIDGQADEESVAAAAMQAAAYIVALQDLLTAESLPAAAVSTDVILVTPENFTPNATATFLDVRKQVSHPAPPAGPDDTDRRAARRAAARTDLRPRARPRRDLTRPRGELAAPWRRSPPGTSRAA